MGYQPVGAPKTKKLFRERVLAGRQVIYSTSIRGDEPEGTPQDLPDGRYLVAGPSDYHTWYATVSVKTVAGVQVIKVT